MKDLPGILLVATIWAYWFGVGLMVARVRRETHTLGGLVPEQRLEQYLWLLWVPLVIGWIALPYVALMHPHSPWAVPMFRQPAPAYGALRWIAVALALAGLMLTSRCWSRMGRHWRMAVSDAGREELITDGPFRFVRHPIYALQRLMMVCTFVVMPTWPVLGLAVLHIVLTQIKARTEETHLLAIHAEAYRAYASRTRRFCPRWSS
jgi:protein-S-isoprenylcysteine O-methyltransferase Ste14